MINLLPEKEKQKLAEKQNVKMTAIFGLALLIDAVCFFLILLSIKFYILGATVYQKYALEQTEKEYQTADFLKFRVLLQDYNSKFIHLESFYSSERKISALLYSFLDVEKPAGIYFTELTLDVAAGKPALRVLGYAAAREDLLAFQKNLNESKAIKNPYFSPESWVRAKGIDFVLTAFY